MATQAKGQHGPGKEKRGTSPSSYMRHTDATTTSSRRSPSAPSPSRPPDKKQTPLTTTTTTSEKRIPNYLKPTLSSSPNLSSTQGKTQTSSSHNTAQKPTLHRRRSFDKPPSPNSLLLKSHTIVNPKEKTVVRSSSMIMPKTSSSFSKPHQDKFLKAHKDAGGKFHVLSSSVSKKTTPVKKQNADAAAVPTKASATTSMPDLTADSAPLVECHKKDQESSSSVTDVEEEERELLSSEESKIELPPHVSALDEDQKEEDIKPDTGGNETVVKNQNEAEIKTFEEPSSVLENQNESLDVVDMEGVEDGEEILEETRKDDESHESHHQEEIVDGDDKEGEESATEDSKDKSVDEEEEEEVGEGNSTESKEREKVNKEDTVTEAKTHMDNNTAGGKQQQQQRQGKETQQAYNDVIEETASKLREERKNKVKALAGAFETVISLQKPEA